jgi:hypothetical protein
MFSFAVASQVLTWRKDIEPIVKTDAGTCGMRIMTVREACEAVGPNRKQHNEAPATCTRTRVFGLSVAASRQ